VKSDYLIASDIRKNKNTLMHHGIDGQRWGVKHGPPYPLGSGVSTGSSLRKGARAKTIAKAAVKGAALGAVVGGAVGGPVSAGLSSIASAGASAIATAISTRKKKGNEITVKKPRLDVHEGDISYENNNPTKEDKNLARLITSKGYGEYILDEAAEANDHNWPAFEKYTESNSAFIDTKNKNSSITFNSERSEIKNDKKSGAVEGKVYTVDSVEVPVFNDGNYDLDRSCKFTREYYDAYDGEHLGSKKVKVSSSKKSSGSNKASSAKPKISDTKIKNAIMDNMRDVKDKNGTSYSDYTPMSDLKRLNYDPDMKVDTWTDGHGNYFTIEVHTDPKTGQDVFNPKHISWDD